MSKPKNSAHFAELERLMSDYFSKNISPVMSGIRSSLDSKRSDEMRAHQSSLVGILSGVDTNGMSGNLSRERLQAIGEWSSKTTGDYLKMVKDSLVKDGSLQKDLAVIARDWRTTMVKEIGRDRYDTVSKQLGCDLAYAYLDHRLEELMIDKMVKDRMPKSTTDYILRKASENSLFGLTDTLSKSPLTEEIECRGEQAYKPSGKEKLAARAAGAIADGVALGAASGWAAVAKYVGVDVVLSTSIDHATGKAQKKPVTVEQCISKGVFSSDENVFTGFRKQASAIKPQSNQFIKSVNDRLSKKIMSTVSSSPTSILNKTGYTFPISFASSSDQNDGKYKDVPLVVAPGDEEEYLKEEAETERLKAESAKVGMGSGSQSYGQSEDDAQAKSDDQSYHLPAAQENNGQSPAGSSSNGWSTLLNATGMSGIGDVTRNLGYVISMLPDLLVGMFTGKTQSLNIKSSMMPIASILAGMFVKNPILKMLLIGMGGANLLNKAGHETLEWQKQGQGNDSKLGQLQEQVSEPQYKRYADEQLNPRITNPILQGNALIANIDNVPCNITLTDNVVNAYNAGALPLNTLANAVLAKHDEMKDMVRQQTIEQSMQQQDYIHRSR